MSDDNPTAAKSGRSWRDISQEVTPRAMSRKGRRRQRLAWFKAGMLSVLLGGVAYTAWEVTRLWQNDRAALAAAGSEPVRGLTLETDGTLTKKWVEGVLALPPGITLMALDLPALRAKLTAFGQVRGAVITRSFPDMLVVNLQERTPVARVQVQSGHDQPQQLFVARDGMVYDGVNYDRPLVASLPWLAGIRLVRTGKGFAPVDGMAEVSDLLSTAQLQAPHLYRNWLIVSLDRLAEHDEIVVKAQDVPEIVFTRKEDFFKQIAQLDYVTDMAQKFPDSGLLSINLALGGQVPVQLAHAPADSPRRDFTPSFTLQNNQRKGNRDL